MARMIGPGRIVQDRIVRDEIVRTHSLLRFRADKQVNRAADRRAMTGLASWRVRRANETPMRAATGIAAITAMATSVAARTGRVVPMPAMYSLQQLRRRHRPNRNSHSVMLRRRRAGMIGKGMRVRAMGTRAQAAAIMTEALAEKIAGVKGANGTRR